MSFYNNKKKLLIAGASGFLGSRILSEALKRNIFDIYALSRTAHPSILTCNNNNNNNNHNNKINWLKCDMTDPQSVKLTSSSLEAVEFDACIHSIGTLFENQSYKKWKSCSTFNNASTPSFSFPPLNTANGNTNNNNNIKMLNFESAVNLLEMVSTFKSKPSSFLYISTEDNLLPFPLQKCILDQNYFRYKRKFESVLAGSTDIEHKLVVRPGIMYADNMALSIPISAALTTMNIFKTQFLPSSLAQMLPDPPARPLHVDLVASFIIDAILKSLIEPHDGSKSKSGFTIYDTKSILNYKS